MATKILVGLAVALVGSGLGVYVAFHEGSSANALTAPQTSPVSVSERPCCAMVVSCCDDGDESCCKEALAACAGSTVCASTPAKPAQRARIGIGQIE
jgi:hypothetical protein